MADKTNVVLLAFVGVAMVAMALYLQWFTMDLSQYSLSQYIERDVTMPEWWAAIGSPLVVGASYLLFALGCSVRPPTPRLFSAGLTACVAAGAVLCFLNAILGVMALVLVSVLLFSSLRQNHS